MKLCQNQNEFKEWQQAYRAKLQGGSSTASMQDLLVDIRKQIQDQGDAAVMDYTRRFDKVTVDFNLKVSAEDIKSAYDALDQAYISALKRAKHNIEVFHRKQLPKNWEENQEGVRYGNRFTPISAVGIYVPGGRAVYPSTVLMDAIPAMIAGVSHLAMVTPPQADGHVPAPVLVAADICGVSEIFRVGGAQAVFALALGTETIPKVDKIVGPGNVYVTQAKQMVYGDVDIDKPAGPSEVLVYIQDAQYASYAAAELLAQLEHDPLANAIVISEKAAVLDAVESEFKRQLPLLKRQDVLMQSRDNVCSIQSHSIDESIDYINQIASEHLVLLIDEYAPILDRVQHAGSIFCGPYTPVTLGDYYAGPNHVLPTEGTARFASPLGVMDYMKYSSFLSYSREQLDKAREDLKCLTEHEGFDAHYNSVAQRFQDAEQ